MMEVGIGNVMEEKVKDVVEGEDRDAVEERMDGEDGWRRWMEKMDGEDGWRRWMEKMDGEDGW
ncbi:MAG: hypothetical protein UIV44_00255 [Bacteroidales bacterium]